MTSRAKRPAKAAGIAGFSAAVAVALVQVLQQTVGAFTERPGIKVAIVFAAFFAGFVGARLRERSTAKSTRAAREEHLPTLLAVWPAPRSGDADPSCLGVFPSRRDLPAERPYIERDLDRHGGLQPAIVPGALVVVVGEARAGAPARRSRPSAERCRTRRWSRRARLTPWLSCSNWIHSSG